MKLTELHKVIAEGIHNNIIIGYHRTKSLSMVKSIFREGFKDLLGAGRLCFTLDLRHSHDWDFFGPYVIKFSAPFDPSQFNIEPETYGKHITHHKKEKGNAFWNTPNAIGYLSSAESGIPPSLAKPIKWGIAIDKHVYWMGNDPSKFDINKIKHLISKSPEYNTIAKHSSVNDDEKEIFNQLLDQPWGYADDPETEEVQSVNALLKQFSGDMMKAYRASNMTLNKFKSAYEALVQNGDQS